jgi:ABC-2 type transport system permease protein
MAWLMMAWLSFMTPVFSADARGQFAAIAQVRWRLFVNSLRSRTGRLELVSHIFIGLAFALGGLGGAVGLGAAAWTFVSEGNVEWLALLLWPVFLFWQLFPLMATTFTENLDSSNLLRFPLSYRSYFLIRLAYGSFDPATALGSLWLLGITLGIGFADRGLFLWTALVLLAFALVNILCARMIFAWLERWLAQRRTREILGILFFLFILSFQFIGPLMNHYGGKPRPAVMQLAREVSPAQRVLPPGLAAEAIARMFHGRFSEALGFFVPLCVYGISILWVLNLRLRAQYRGENLSEAPGRTASRQASQELRLGWSVLGLPGTIAAIFEKEVRYLSRSGPMLFTLIMPVFVLLVLRLGPANSKSGGFLLHAPNLAFPMGAGYTLLLLTNLVYNNFGGDGPGLQLFFASPVPFRKIVLGKNLAHMAVLTLEIVLVWLAVCLMYRPPSSDVTLATLAALLFAAPANLAAGNLLSIYSPKKIEYGTFGRQRASQTTVLASLGIQIGIVALSALVLVISRLRGNFWLATPFFLVLAAFTCAGYALVLNRVDRMALDRRETLISELSRG